MSNLATIVNNILADSGIDDLNVVVTTGSYSNPAWITALSWSKITSTPTTLLGYGITDAVPQSRTITINGTSQDLSANRTYNVGTVTSVAALTLGTTGTDLSSTVANVTTTPVITLNVPTASAANRGALSSADWTTFNGKQNALTLTTTGSSGAATLIGATLNIPNYGSALSGYLPLAGGTMTGGITFASAPTYTPLRFTGGVADYTIAEQDGAGRVNWYWNKSGTGGAPTYQVSSEDAIRLKFSTAQAAGAESGIGVYYAPAGTAGGAITWQEIMGAFHNGFRVLPAATFASSVTANGVLTIGASGTVGVKYVSISPSSTTTPAVISGAHAGVGPYAIAMQSGGGNLLIGTTTDNGTDRLQVSGSASVSGILNINSGASATSTNITNSGDFISNWIGNSTVQLFSIRNNSTSGVYINTQNSNTLYLGVSAATTGGTTVNHLSITSTGAATFSSSVSVSGAYEQLNGTINYIYDSGNVSYYSLQNSSTSFLLRYNGADRLTIASTGAATFSSSVTAASLIVNTSGQSRTITTFYGAGSDGLNIFIGGGGLSSGTGGGASNLGSNNTSIGATALRDNTTGNQNSAFGVNALLLNTTGINNTANGVNALFSNTTGGNNIANGVNALSSNTTGGNNTAIGRNAGRFITGGATGNTITNNSIFLGFDTRAAADNQTNQIVIGYQETGLGSNTTIIGNSSTVTTALRGRLILGTTTDNTVDKLQVSGSANITGNLTVDTNTLFVDATNNRVGIGTTSPSHLLTLNNSVSGGTYLDLFQTYVDGNDWRNWTIGTNNQAFGDFNIIQSNATGGNPTSAGTSKLYISKAGNVGIGTTSPWQNLHVIGSTAIGSAKTSGAGSATISLIGGVSDTREIGYVFSGAANREVGAKISFVGSGNLSSYQGGYITFSTSEAGGTTFPEAMRITSGGNVGIGTASPNATLDVYKGAQSNTISLANSTAWLRGVDVGLAIGQDNGAGGYGTWIQSIRTDNTSFSLAINPNGGNVKIGTLTDAGYKLDVNGTLRIIGASLFNSDLFTYNNGGIFFSGSGSFTSGIFQNAGGLQLQSGGTPRLTIASTGAATFSSSVTASSLIKSGGTSAQILAADGSVITAGTNITISGGTISATVSGFISSLNGLTAATQTFAVGSSGTDFNISSATSTHTFNIPDASPSNRGLVTTTDQTINGIKRFRGGITTENTGSALTMYYGIGGGTFEYRSSISTLSDGAMQLFAQSNLQYERIILGMNGATVAGNVLIGKTTDDTINKLQVQGGASVTNAHLGAGTASIAPLKFTTGVLKTTPAAGDVEVNGGYLFYTQSARRGVLTPVQWTANTATRTYTATTTSQNLFGAGNSTFTAVANTTYYFEAEIHLSSLSATANAVGFGLSLTGAVASNISYTAITQRQSTIATPVSPNMCRIAVTATTAITPSIASATSAAIKISGIVRFTTGGSVIPVISQIGATSASVLGIGSYFKFEALGSNTDTKNPTNGWA